MFDRINPKGIMIPTGQYVLDPTPWREEISAGLELGLRPNPQLTEKKLHGLVPHVPEVKSHHYTNS